MQQPIPPRLACSTCFEPCGELNCEVCKIIGEKVGGDWCFEWLRLLKDFDVSYGELADRDRQVLLTVDHTDYEVRHIRSKLAILQTQTVNYFDSQSESLRF